MLSPKRNNRLHEEQLEAAGLRTRYRVFLVCKLSCTLRALHPDTTPTAARSHSTAGMAAAPHFFDSFTRVSKRVIQ